MRFDLKLNKLKSKGTRKNYFRNELRRFWSRLIKIKRILWYKWPYWWWLFVSNISLRRKLKIKINKLKWKIIKLNQFRNQIRIITNLIQLFTNLKIKFN